ncbi:MAG: efflux RND transporter periplasmic adaptor subunit [Candidatus Omnitrophica bacterium]|nr:efflux RND transporter periplasmic adaptor subunit [Candidatus Omnitrophota bacterium]
MTKNRRNAIVTLLFLFAASAFILCSCATKEKNGSEKTKVINPVIGDIVLTVMTTGVVEPQNRLEIKPSISGRIEEILAYEGDKVKKGDILAWMSSTERAALIDAARSQGQETLSYWEEVYKKTPIISPIDGEVIVRSVEPGQTVTTSDAILVLSDRLVISAQFDETDIGRVKIGQEAFIALDSYPDLEINGTVDHIAYESEIVNNVTIYNVDIVPKDAPEIFRSGMSVTVEVVEKKMTGVITIPADAVHYDKERQFVMMKDRRGRTIERDIVTGLSDEKNIEIISGLAAEDNVIVKGAEYLPKRKNSGVNPFMPSRR